MPRRLEMESLQVDLANVSQMLETAKQYNDKATLYQFERRKKNIEDKLAELGDIPQTRASVVLFFGGDPVIGSVGVAADFAGKVLQSFQEIVSKSFATQAVGKLGERGRVPYDKDANLMVTGVAHGSFGFVLNEASEQMEMFDTTLKDALDFSVSAIVKSSTEDDEVFEALTEELNHRLLLALKTFFHELDNNNATIRMVDDSREYIIDDKAVDRARTRIEATTIEEEEESPKIGVLSGFLPKQRRFELTLSGGEVISGSATEKAAEKFNKIVAEQGAPIGHECTVSLEVRTVKPFNRPERNVYRLLSIDKVAGN